MWWYKLIKIKGKESDRLGYLAPRLYRLYFNWRELKYLGFRLVKERLDGWTIWWVYNEEDYTKAVDILNEAKKAHEFEFKVSE